MSNLHDAFAAICAGDENLFGMILETAGEAYAAKVAIQMLIDQLQANGLLEATSVANAMRQALPEIEAQEDETSAHSQRVKALADVIAAISRVGEEPEASRF